MNNLLKEKKNLYKIKKRLLLGLYSIYISNIILQPTQIQDSVIEYETTTNIDEENVTLVDNENSLTTTGNKYNFPCNIELQQHIIDVANYYGYDPKIAFIIIDQESGGKWDTNGCISPTNDYGLTQINECNMDNIYEAIGITKEEILHNPYKAIEAQGYILSNIMDIYDYEDRNDIDYKNVFGTYNGWTNWENKEMAVKYANSCMERLEEHFGITEEDIKGKRIVLR